MQKAADTLAQLKQLFATFRQQHKMVAIAQVMAALEFMFDELVKQSQIDIFEKLTVQVPNRQALARHRAEQRLVRQQASQQLPLALDHIVLGAIMKNLQAGQLQRILIECTVPQIEEDLLVDTHEVIANVEL